MSGITKPTGWLGLKLDELGFVGRGKSRHRPRNDPALYGGEYPFVQTADIMAADCYIRTYSKTYSEQGLAQSKLWTDKTLCMTIAGENTAETAILDFPACFPDSVVGFVPDERKSDIYFVKYALEAMKLRFKSVSRGATQDNLSLSKLLSFEIPTPPILIQKKIGAIFSVYDDLIENNRRRIAILEEMARRLYEEWFVHFRFPGHEDTTYNETEHGQVPEGWERRAFSELASFINGYAFKPSDWSEQGLPIVKIRELKSGITPDTPRYEGTLAEKYQVRDGDVLFSWSADLEAYVWQDGKAWLNQHLFKVLPQPNIQKLFLFFSLREQMVDFRARSAGTTMRHIKRSALDEVHCVLPADELRNRFEALVSPLVAQLLNIRKENANLRAQRNLLLPKLVSGEIDVSEVEETLEGAVA